MATFTGDKAVAEEIRQRAVKVLDDPRLRQSAQSKSGAHVPDDAAPRCLKAIGIMRLANMSRKSFDTRLQRHHC